MGKISLLIVLMFLLMLGLFAIENTEVVTFKVPFSHVYETSKIALVLLSSVVGALFVLIYFFIRDTKRVIDTLQVQKRQRRESRMQELHSKALNAMLGHRYDDAKQAYKDMLKEDPEHMEALLGLGDIALTEGETSDAIRYYKNARDINPRNVQSLLAMYNVLSSTGKDDSAFRILEEILDIDDENLTALCFKRDILERRGKWHDLFPLQKSIIKLTHNEKEKQKEETRQLGYKYEYGRASLEGGDIEKAEKAFRTIVRVDTDFVPAYLALAEVMVAKREHEEAIDFLEKSYASLRSKTIIARLEDLLIAEGEPGRLLRIYRNAVKKSPSDHALKFMLGRLYARLEMVDDAIETLDSIDTAVYQNPELHAIRADLYKRRKQPAKAIDELKLAVEMGRCAGMMFRCSTCKAGSVDWSGRCTECGEWNTLSLNI